jgi:hypothetical protein
MKGRGFLSALEGAMWLPPFFDGDGGSSLFSNYLQKNWEKIE